MQLQSRPYRIGTEYEVPYRHPVGMGAVGTPSTFDMIGSGVAQAATLARDTWAQQQAFELDKRKISAERDTRIAAANAAAAQAQASANRPTSDTAKTALYVGGGLAVLGILWAVFGGSGRRRNPTRRRRRRYTRRRR